MDDVIVDFDIDIIKCPHATTCPNYEDWKCFNEFVEICSTKFVLDLSAALKKRKEKNISEVFEQD